MATTGNQIRIRQRGGPKENQMMIFRIFSRKKGLHNLACERDV
jgi:hypothetical protein